MKGDTDMSVVNDTVINDKEGDEEVRDLVHKETDVGFFVVGNNKTRSGGALFPYLDNTTYDLDKHGIFNTINDFNYNTIVCI